MSSNKSKIIVILGPTASGKTKLGVKLAAKFKGEIISADSRQVYRGMDIGTGKDLAEYKIGKKTIPHHLIDIKEPRQNFNLAEWQKLVLKSINQILEQGKTPFVVGGTGLYISALTEGYLIPQIKPDKKLREKLERESLKNLQKQLKKLDPQTYQKIDRQNKRRLVRALEVILKTKKSFAGQKKKKIPAFDFLILGRQKTRGQTINLIDQRVEKRLKEGMIEEVKKLIKKGVSYQRLYNFGLEYRLISQYLKGELSHKEMREKLKIAIHQFAKRQMTWFKKMKKVKWVKSYGEAERLVREFLR